MINLKQVTLLTLIVMSNMIVYAQSFVYSKEQSKSENLHDYLSFYVDSSNHKKNSKIRYQEFKSLESENFGHTKYGIWYKFQVFNDTPEELLLQVGPEWTPNIEFFKIDSSNNFNFNKKGGTLSPYSKREVKSNKHFFNLKMTEKEHAVFYVKISGDHVVSPHFMLGKRSDLLGDNRFEDRIYFMYIGIILLLILYNSFITILTKKISFLYYSFYILCMTLNILFNKGYPNEWIDFYWVSNHHSVFSALSIVFILLSLGSVLKVRAMSLFLHYAKILIIFTGFCAILLNSLDLVLLANEITIFTIVMSAFWGLLVGVKNLNNGNSASQLILIGYVAFSVGGVIHALQLNGYIPYNWGTSTAYFIGSGLEMIMISISFGMNINVMNKDKFKAQLESFELAKKNEELVLNQNKLLESKVDVRTKELFETNNELQKNIVTVNEQNLLLELSTKNITDSISYSKKIQDALLPDKDVIEKAGLCVDIFYQPKDVLSGDFYWFGERRNKVFIAVADCTGHGVPGAMLSISGHSLLNRIVFEEKCTEVDLILNRLHIGLVELLRVDKTDTQDGMDIQLVCFDKSTGETSYAGASNPLYYSDDEGSLQKIVADRLSIGGTNIRKPHSFTKKILPTTWRNLFLFSDGYQDQFGDNGKKFMVGKFKQSLIKDAHLSPKNQIELLKKEFGDWKGNEIQTDDVLLISVKKGQEMIENEKVFDRLLLRVS
jgi:serine phosphatase RsbU (regulator of sigma subunit)